MCNDTIDPKNTADKKPKPDSEMYNYCDIKTNTFTYIC